MSTEEQGRSQRGVRVATAFFKLLFIRQRYSVSWSNFGSLDGQIFLSEICLPSPQISDPSSAPVYENESA